MNIIIIMGNPYCSTYLSIFNEHSQWPSLVVWFYDSPISDFPEASPLLRWNWVGSPVPKQSHFAYRRCGFFSSFGQEGNQKKPGEIAWHVYTTCVQTLVYIVWIDGFRHQNYQITPLFRPNKSHSIHESGCLVFPPMSPLNVWFQSRYLYWLVTFWMDIRFTYDACRWGQGTTLQKEPCLCVPGALFFFSDKP